MHTNLFKKLSVGLYGVLLFTVAFFYLHLIFFLSEKPIPTDFLKFHQSALFAAAGKSIYTPVPLNALPGFEEMHLIKPDETAHPNLNPPFQTLLFMPFAKFDFGKAFQLWNILSLLGSLAALFAIHVFYIKNKKISCFIGLSLLLLLYFPTLMTVKLGQLSLLLFVLSVAAWLSGRAGKKRTAGLLLGLAFSFKLFFGLFLVYFAARREWRVVAWMGGTFLLCALSAALMFGLDAYFEYVAVLREITWYSASWNASLLGFFGRIFGAAGTESLLTIPFLTHVLVYGLSLLLGGILLWTAWKTKDAGIKSEDLGFAFTLSAMLLISPFGWMYYFPLLLIPALVIWSESSALPNARIYKLLLGGCWLLSSMPFFLIPSMEVNNGVVCFASAGAFFYALMGFNFLTMIVWRLPLKHSRQVSLFSPPYTGKNNV